MFFAVIMAVIWILLLLVEMNFQCIFAYQVYNKIITINNEGDNTNKCCVDGKCPCSSLEMALVNVNNNTLINITSAMVRLSVQTNISHGSMIGITGSNHTVIDCNNTGGILFYDCGEIDIFGITWHQCGTKGAISLDHSHDISVENCNFQSSNTYGIAAQSVAGKIVITDSEFLYNNRSSSGSSGLYILKNNPPMNLELVIIRSIFKYNGNDGAWQSPAGGVYIDITMPISSSLINISIEDSMFMHNYGAGGIYVSTDGQKGDLNAVIHLKNISFKSNVGSGPLSGGAIDCYASGSTLNFTMTNCSVDNGITILSNTMHTSILIDKSLWGYINGMSSLSIESHGDLTLGLSNMNLIKTQVSVTVVQQGDNYRDCVLKFDRFNNKDNSTLKIDGERSNGCKCSITNCQFTNNHVTTGVIDIKNVNMYYPDTQPSIQISNTVISDNNNRNGIVRLAYQMDGGNTPQGNVQLSFVTFTGNSAAESSTLCLSNCKVRISHKMNFTNNAGKSGAGMYFTNYSYAVLDDNAEIEFMKNIVPLGGGAIYADYPPSDSSMSKSWHLFGQTSGKSVTFINNTATEAGNSIYFNIPTDADIITDPTIEYSIMYVPSQFNYSGDSYQNQIATSPYNLVLNTPAVCISPQCDNGGDYKVEGVMLGEELSFTAKMMDYFNNSAEGVIFLVECMSNCEDYSLTGFTKYKNVIVQENPLRNITIVGKEVKNFNTTVSLYLSQVTGTINSNVRMIGVSIMIVLHPCKTGFKYDSRTGKCICNTIPDLVQCMVNDAKIKKGYWYGDLDGDIVVGVCPVSYCNYPLCDISENYCGLSLIQDHQCHSHRTGTACSNCEDNYTLAFDLEDCIPTSNCHIWLTIVIIISVMTYWVVVLLVILCITGFVNVPVITGYAYGIIYFYSILYLFVSDSLVSNTMTYLIGILSGFANLNPRFLGILCFVKELSGIDQQFIHYVHPLAISLLLFLISRVAKCSGQVTRILGRAGIIRATCLLILLSYTSVASTSLQLLRPLSFTKSNGDHTVRTYLSPDIPYFSGRHIIYTIVAVVCMIVIAIGLPVFLLLQPYLKRCRGINFIRIVPLMDQFQQCFKPKYHSFAAFYLICRLLVFLILCLEMIQYNIRFLLLQILSFIIAMIHAWLQPYRENKLNSLDQTILLIALMIISLNVGIPCTSLHTRIEMSDSFVAILALLPLILFIGFILSSTALGRLLWQKLTCKSTSRRRGSTVR